MVTFNLPSDRLFCYDSDSLLFEYICFKSESTAAGETLSENEIETAIGHGKNKNSGSFTND